MHQLNLNFFLIIFFLRLAFYGLNGLHRRGLIELLTSSVHFLSRVHGQQILQKIVDIEAFVVAELK